MTNRKQDDLEIAKLLLNQTLYMESPYNECRSLISGGRRIMNIPLHLDVAITLTDVLDHPTL